VDVMSLEKDETHDLELKLDNDAGLLRLLMTVSDSRMTSSDKLSTDRRSQLRSADRSAAVEKYGVSKS